MTETTKAGRPKMAQQARKRKKNLEKIVDDTATENIFSKFRTKLRKAEKGMKDIPSGMKKDPKTKTEIQAKLANKALQDDKPFQEFKDTRREVFGTQRYGKGGKVKKKKSSRKAMRGGGCEIR